MDLKVCDIEWGIFALKIFLREFGLVLSGLFFLGMTIMATFYYGLIGILQIFLDIKSSPTDI